MHVRRNRGGQVIVINPVVETGMVNFRVPSDPRSLLFGTKIATLYVQPHIGGDLALLTGIAKRIDEMGAHDEDVPARTRQRLARCLQRPSASDSPGSEIQAKSGVDQKQIDEIAERYAAAEERRLQLDDGHHASCARRAERAGDRQSGLDARHGRPAGCRADADSRPFERARHRLGRRHAEAEGRDLRAAAKALRRQAADHAGPRHAGLHGSRRKQAS